MEWVAHQREGDAMRVNQFEEIPETAVQNRVATRDIKIRCAPHPLCHALYVCKHRHQPLPRHLNEFGMAIGKDVAVLATLVALVSYMPLECKVVHCFAYFSPAPQAVPQAAGFSSAGLSPAPQALPQAAGFSSAGLSPAPQAAPQAAGFSLCFNIPCALCAKL